MTLHYWQYFLALEADLAATTRYVEPSSRNMGCYSIEFARIILAAGSEVDVLCKVLCDHHGLTPSPQNIDGYRDAITPKFPGFTKLEIRLPMYNMTRLPWTDWESGTNPNWWRLHNKVKHNRHEKFEDANLKNAIDSVAGLFVLVAYVCNVELRARTVQLPQLVALDPGLSSDISTNLRPGHVLPDFDPS